MSPDRPRSLEAQVEPLDGPLPVINWRWDPETDILSGAFRREDIEQTGFHGMIELTNPGGAVIVLDLGRGVLGGLDVVVWPEVVARPDLVPPAAGLDGQIMLPVRAPQRGPESREVETPISVAANPRQTMFHISLGDATTPGSPADRIIRVAERFLVELDSMQRLIGFWLLEVEAFPLELEPDDPYLA
ncbi:MAG: hypothetical protein ACREL6_10425 [Gemmatimonadales bacterium]